MDPWSTFMRLVDEELIEPRHHDAAQRLVRSAARANLRDPRSAVASALVERLEFGVPIDDAIEAVEEMIAIEHNRMLINACRSSAVDDEPPGVVSLLHGRTQHPIFAA